MMDTQYNDLVDSLLDYDLSEKQAAWLAAVWIDGPRDMEFAALAYAIALRGGRDMAPFKATDAELSADVSRILDQGISHILECGGVLQ